MKLNIQFEELDRLRRRMGAPLAVWSSDADALPPPTVIREELENVGIRLNYGEWEVGNSGLLSVNGEHIVLYIMDARVPRGWEELDKGPEKRPKVHLVECLTLLSMENSGRRERYIASANRDGEFIISAPANAWSGDEDEQIEKKVRLFPCRHCLEKLDWQKFSGLRGVKRGAIVEGFKFSDFFLEYATFFRKNPRYDERNAPRGGYPKSWHQTSRSYRESVAYKCERCGVALPDRTDLLHCHHRNGVLSDISQGNLEALCALCHSEQPYHGRLSVTDENRQFIERRRAGRV
ncbi:MAG: hypothetical protein MI824_02360 [Hyphomicrobiales bacterium]|nr:hypothetical protein [Hyphomicrobiales bacterium]